MRIPFIILAAADLVLSPGILRADWAATEHSFREAPMESRRDVGPLFFMFGTESAERLSNMVDRVAEAGNGMLTAESRHHKDWMGPGWWRDLRILVDEAKRKDLQVVIFDDPWFPSQMMKGRVPAERAARCLAVTEVAGGKSAAAPSNHVITIAGEVDKTGAFIGSTLREVTGIWNPPDGNWKAMEFTAVPRATMHNGLNRPQFCVNGLNAADVDWFLDYVYAEHYKHFKDDFGKTIVGFFFDEPETHGDWGPELEKELKARGVDKLKALVAYMLRLAGPEQDIYKYAFRDARAEVWGRTMYGRQAAWCRRHGVFSTGHFMEHDPVSRWFYGDYISAGNVMQLMKFEDIPGVDLVCNQLHPGERNWGMYQMPKIVSSVSHTYQKTDDRAMCEIFGAYGQKLSYPDMKWITDHHELRGVNVLIPHSFSTRAPEDIPVYAPYFYNGGFEPRYPLYRVWADYTGRLSALLTGGRHVADIAYIHPGQSFHFARCATPEPMTAVIQDAQFDCDWINYDLVPQMKVEGKTLRLGKENYRVLMIPPVGILPIEVVEKAEEFFQAGGVVMLHGYYPSKSATFGHPDSEVVSRLHAIFDSHDLRAILIPPVARPDIVTPLAAAGITPACRVAAGAADNWLHILHREKDGRDIFFVCNQNTKGGRRDFTFRVRANGFPEVWNAMDGSFTRPDYKRLSDGDCEISLPLEERESALIVFNSVKRDLPPRPDNLAGTDVPVTFDAAAAAKLPPAPKHPGVQAPYPADPFLGTFTLAAKPAKRVFLVMDDVKPEFAGVVFVNGERAGGFIGKPGRVEITAQAKPGTNTVRIDPFRPSSVKVVVEN